MRKLDSSIIYLYALSHLGIFFISDAVYWESWRIYLVPKEDIFNEFGSLLTFTPYLHSYLLPIGPWIYRGLTFIMFFAVTYLLDRIISNLKLISDEDRYLVVLFFTVLPFNMTRITLINFDLTICLTLFFIAWRYKHIKHICFPLFWLSFTTPVFLFFYVLVVLHLYFEMRDFKWEFSLKIFLSKIDYFLLPILFIIINFDLLKSYGYFQKYSALFWLVIVAATKNIISLLLFFPSMEINTFLILLLAFVIWKVLPKFDFKAKCSVPRRNLFIFGFCSFLLAMFPYWSLGEVPDFNDWTSRYQIIMPFGISIMLTAIYYVFDTKIRIIFLLTIITLSISFNIKSYIGLFRDWNKQLEIVKLLREDADLDLNNNVVIVSDNSFKSWDRTLRYVELTRLFNTAYDSANLFVLDVRYQDSFYSGSLSTAIDKVDPELNRKDPLYLMIDSRKPKNDIETVINYFYPKLDISIH
jgi:hypothetical protein